MKFQPSAGGQSRRENEGTHKPNGDGDLVFGVIYPLLRGQFLRPSTLVVALFDYEADLIWLRAR
jgi:hypothetical protein